jgi:hypothetical protein
MLLINWTKNFSQTYWRPVFDCRTDGGELWYFEVKFLRVQACLYSRDLGEKFLEKTREGLRCHSTK